MNFTLFGGEKEETVNKNMQYYLDHSQYDKAAEQCVKLIKQFQPNNLNLFVKLAEIYLKAGLKDKSLAQYQEAAEKYTETGNAVKAITIYRTMLNIDPRLPNIRVKLAELYVGRGEIDPAWKEGMEAIRYFDSRKLPAQSIELLEIMARLPFNDADKVHRIGEMFYLRSQPEKAVTQFLNAAELHLEKMEIKQCAKAYKEVLKINPQNLEAQKGLEVVQCLLTEQEAAVEDSPDAIYPNQSLWDNFSEEQLDNIFQKLSLPKKEIAAEQLKEHYELGLAYQEMDLLDAAVEEFIMAAEDSAMQKNCYQMLKECYTKKGLPRLANDYQIKIQQLGG